MADRYCHCRCHDGAEILEFMPCCKQLGVPRAELEPLLPPKPVGPFLKYNNPLMAIKSKSPQRMVADEICKVQPMMGPVGGVAFLEPRYAVDGLPVRYNDEVVGEANTKVDEQGNLVADMTIDSPEVAKAQGLTCGKCKRGLSSKEDRNAKLFLCCNCDKDLGL
jgi:hypothetical protein